ncbi:Uncharacterised protein [Bordetella pertussis]|nr:Uncharacterised protein [Bordetella pertussis]
MQLASPSPAVGVTRPLADAIVATASSRLGAATLQTAQACLLDSLAVTLAGAQEPLVAVLDRTLAGFGGAGQATLIGHARRFRRRGAGVRRCPTRRWSMAPRAMRSISTICTSSRPCIRACRWSRPPWPWPNTRARTERRCCGPWRWASRRSCASARRCGPTITSGAGMPPARSAISARRSRRVACWDWTRNRRRWRSVSPVRRPAARKRLSAPCPSRCMPARRRATA